MLCFKCRARFAVIPGIVNPQMLICKCCFGQPRGDEIINKGRNVIITREQWRGMVEILLEQLAQFFVPLPAMSLIDELI
jgi:hypothetical protein